MRETRTHLVDTEYADDDKDYNDDGNADDLLALILSLSICTYNVAVVLTRKQCMCLSMVGQ